MEVDGRPAFSICCSSYAYAHIVAAVNGTPEDIFLRHSNSNRFLVSVSGAFYFSNNIKYI